VFGSVIFLLRHVYHLLFLSSYYSRYARLLKRALVNPYSSVWVLSVLSPSVPLRKYRSMTIKENLIFTENEDVKNWLLSLDESSHGPRQ
jgi:hypothetical protein